MAGRVVVMLSFVRYRCPFRGSRTGGGFDRPFQPTQHRSDQDDVERHSPSGASARMPASDLFARMYRLIDELVEGGIDEERLNALADLMAEMAEQSAEHGDLDKQNQEMSDDAADVQRVLAGDVEAYAALVDRYYDPLVWIARKIGGK